MQYPRRVSRQNVTDRFQRKFSLRESQSAFTLLQHSPERHAPNPVFRRLPLSYCRTNFDAHFIAP
jgi:hypothetical protein